MAFGNVLLPLTYGLRHLFCWLSLCSPQHACVFLPFSQQLPFVDSYSRRDLYPHALFYSGCQSNVAIFYYFFYHIDPFCMDKSGSMFTRATIFLWFYQACSTCSNMDSAHINPESTTMCVLHMSSFFGSNAAVVMFYHV